MTVDGKESWSATLPFTLYDAVVANDGSTVGYVYRDGLEGHPLDHERSEGNGDIFIVVLGTAGNRRLQQVLSQNIYVPIDGLPGPQIQGILLNEKEDRFTIRFTADEGLGENWWVYQLSTGQLLKRFPVRAPREDPEAFGFITVAKSISSVPLNLVHWWNQTENLGAVFMLIDLDGRCVWSRELPTDYTFPADKRPDFEFYDTVQERGAILDNAKPGQFDLWFVTESQRVTFNVTYGQTHRDGWRVDEVARQSYRPPTKAEKKLQPSVESRQLKHLGSFRLEGEVKLGPIRNIRWFGFDQEGRVGILRSGGPDAQPFLLIDSKGAVIAEVPLPSLEGADNPQRTLNSAAYAGTGRWVLVSAETDKERVSAWWYDVEKKVLSDAVQLDCPGIERITGTGDGGFVLLASRRENPHGVTTLYAFDSNGKKLWARDSGVGKQEDFLRPIDVAFLNGEIAVLDRALQDVDFFDRSGRFLRTINLRRSWGREPENLTSIIPDENAGFIIRDSWDAPAFIRMNSDGSVRGTLLPRHRDGRRIDTRGGLCLAPDGHLWASDEHALIRLDKEGVADLVLGDDLDPARLDQIAGVAVDRHGNVYAVDERTGAVHVFDSNGRKLRICMPEPSDFSQNISHPLIAVADDGSVYVSEGWDSHGSESRHRYVHFAPDGRRLGTKKFELDSSRQEWIAQSGTDNLLVLGYQEAFLTDPAGNVLRNIARRADRHWIDITKDAAVAGDGSFVILGAPSSFGLNSEGSTVNFFTKEGIPVRTFPTDCDALLGFSGKQLVMGVYERKRTELEIYDTSGSLVQRLDHPMSMSVFLTREGRELWVFENRTRTVQRYAMP